MTLPSTRFSRLLVAVVLLSAVSRPAAQLPSSAPTEAEKQFRFAEGLMLREFYDMAEAELSGFLARYPDHPLAPRAAFHLVQCMRSQGNRTACLEQISRFAARWPDHELGAKLELVRGDILLQAGKYEAAAKSFAKLRAHPDAVLREAGLYFLAQCHSHSGKLDEAMGIYRDLAALPFDAQHVYRPYAVFALAAGLLHTGNSPEAEKAFSRLADSRELAPAELREEALFRTGESAMQRSDFAGAAAQFGRLLDEFPEGQFGVEAGRRQIRAHLAERDFAAALDLAKAFVATNPEANDRETRYLHGLALSGAGLFAPALELFQQLLSAAGDASDEYGQPARYQCVYCLLQLGRYADLPGPATEFLRTYPHAPEASEVWYMLGAAHFENKQWQEAAAALENGIAKYGDEWAYATDARTRLAQCYDALERPAEAAGVYRKLATDSKSPNPATLLLLAGDRALQAGDAEAAAADYRRVMEQHGDAPELTRVAGLRLARLYTERNQLGQAEQFLAKLLASSPADEKPGLLLLLGFTSLRKGDYEKAEDALRNVIAQGAEPQLVDEARQFLVPVLLERQKTDEALKLFGELLKGRPDAAAQLDSPLLERLLELYVGRHDVGMTEQVAQLMVKLTDGGAPIATYRLAQVHLAKSRLDEARLALEQLRNTQLDEQDPAAATAPSPAQVSSLLGEVLLTAGQPDRAVREFTRSLEEPGLDAQAMARAHWGMASVLTAEDRHKEALRHAVSAFVMTDDPVYTPRAMLLAVQILGKQDALEEAATTWRELVTRYPVFAEQHRDAAPPDGTP